MRNLLFITTIFLACVLSSCKKDVKTIINDTKEASFVIYTFDEYGSPSGSGSGFFIDSKGINTFILDSRKINFLYISYR